MMGGRGLAIIAWVTASAPGRPGRSPMSVALLGGALRREGYEDGISTTHKVLSAAAFIAGDSPIEMLGQYTTIAIEGPNSEGEFCFESGTARAPSISLSFWIGAFCTCRALLCWPFVLASPQARCPPRAAACGCVPWEDAQIK